MLLKKQDSIFQPLIQYAEQTVCRRFRGIGRPCDVADRMAFAVELAGEGVFGRSDGGPFGDPVHVDIVQQNDVAGFIAIAVVVAPRIYVIAIPSNEPAATT